MGATIANHKRALCDPRRGAALRSSHCARRHGDELTWADARSRAPTVVATFSTADSAGDITDDLLSEVRQVLTGGTGRLSLITIRDSGRLRPARPAVDSPGQCVTDTTATTIARRVHR